jgi:hypothetical protein
MSGMNVGAADQASNWEALVVAGRLRPPAYRDCSAPLAQAIERAEREIGRGTALTADELAAAPHVVLHPGGQEQVIRVPLHLAYMERERGQHLRQVVRRGLDHEVGRRHRAPELRLDREAREARIQKAERVDHEVVRTDVRAVPVGVVRKEDDPRALAREDLCDRADRR